MTSLTALACLVVVAQPSGPSPTPWRQSSGIAVWGNSIYVADPERGDVAVFERDGQGAAPVRRIAVGDGPSQLLAAKDGTVYVAVRRSDRVVALRPDGRAEPLALPGEPYALAMNDANDRLYVTLATASEVACLDPKALSVLWTRRVPQDPRPIAWASSGDLYVGHVLGALTVVWEDGSDQTDFKLDPVRDNSVATQVWALASIGDSVRAVYRSVQVGAVASSDEYYGASTPPMELLVATATLDTHRRMRAAEVARIGVEHLVSGPTAVATLGDGLVISSAGSTGVLLPGESTLAIRGGLSALGGTGDSNRFYGVSFSTRELYEVSTAGGKQPKTRIVGRLGSTGLPLVAEAGRRQFFQANMQAGLSCASCHVEGLSDGLVWTREADKPRQTPALAGRLHGTGPYGWDGQQGQLDEYVKQSMIRLRQAPTADQVTALTEYVRDYLPTPKPLPPKSVAQVVRGEAIFRSDAAGCTQCHDPAKGFTDGDSHDVETSAYNDATKQINTPSLTRVALTPPYLHDGSASTLEEVLSRTEGKMGSTAALSDDDRHALVAYLQSL